MHPLPFTLIPIFTRRIMAYPQTLLSCLIQSSKLQRLSRKRYQIAGSPEDVFKAGQSQKRHEIKHLAVSLLYIIIRQSRDDHSTVQNNVKSHDLNYKSFLHLAL
jgi:hypothetical protein